jgi:hypothetical protein
VNREELALLLDKSLDFIVKLSEAENINEEEAIKSIARTIEDTMARTDRPEFLYYLDTSTVKRASETGKRRLIASIDMYTDKFSQQ